MDIACFRCKIIIPSPNDKNADYIMAEDTKDGDEQKTAVICPQCYRPTDTVIWGVHK